MSYESPVLLQGPHALSFDGVHVFTASYLQAGLTWNGYAVPYFSTDEVRALQDYCTEAYPTEAAQVRVSEEGTRVFETDGEGASIEYTPLLVGDVPFWAIGAHSWTWSVLDAR